MTTMRIERYTDSDEVAWDDFVKKSNNGTLFHTIGFLKYHQDRFTQAEHHLLWKRKNTIIAVMPLAISKSEGGLWARSPYGGSFGGIVTGTDASVADLSEIVGLFFDTMRSLCVQKTSIAPTPLIYHQRPSSYLDFFLQANGCAASLGFTSYIPLGPDSFDWIKFSCAKATRKAQREGVTVEQTQELDEFYHILQTNRAEKCAVPTHTKEEIAWIIQNCPGSISIFLARHNGAAAAGAMLLRCNNRVVNAFYWAHLEEFQHVRPLNALVHEMIRWAMDTGFHYFDFGGPAVNHLPTMGPTRFKETFGSTGTFRNTYTWQLPDGGVAQ